MKAIVTGASGFIGGALTRALAQSGIEPIALVRPGTRLDCRTIEADVTSADSMEAVNEPGVKAIFHLAGMVALRKSEEAALWRVNVEGTGNAIALARRLGARLVHVSSVAAVGALAGPGEPLRESSESPVNLAKIGNFESKRIGEALVLEAARGPLDAVVVNPSLVFGPGDARKPARAMHVKAARGELKFYPDGGVNVVALEDVIAGIRAALERGRAGQRYLLAGENLTMGEVFALVAEAAGVPAPRKRVPTWLLRASGVAADLLAKDAKWGSGTARAATLYHWFDSSKAQRELGFAPRPAREAIAASVAWMRENGLLA